MIAKRPGVVVSALIGACLSLSAFSPIPRIMTGEQAAGAAVEPVSDSEMRAAILGGLASGTVSGILGQPADGPPTITGILPHGGTTAGGAVVTISGSNFTSDAVVTVGGIPVPVVFVSSTQLTITVPAHWAGRVEVVVATLGGTASPDGGFTYATPPTFSDDPLEPQTTIIKAVHVSELRQAVDDLRARWGLPPSGFCCTLIPGVSVISAHDPETLRLALWDVYADAGVPPPVYTDPTIVQGSTVVSAVHLAELRAAVLAIW